ncbi:MAG: hypothetical protein OXL97_05920 [Chloroflexota bacterium]|nr:hypothetical protein [Chloroflexota bacterium]MDE2885140.1 hypothetical protein [Chloroflexota bacterium]
MTRYSIGYIEAGQAHRLCRHPHRSMLAAERCQHVEPQRDRVHVGIALLQHSVIATDDEGASYRSLTDEERRERLLS